MWMFPENILFEMEMADGRLLQGCRYINGDKNHVIVDYVGQFGMRIRIQVCLDEIRTLMYLPPAPVAVLTKNGILDPIPKESQ